MLFAALILQIAAARPPLSAADSIALIGRVREARFQFIMDWRYQVLWDGFSRRLPATVQHFVGPSAAADPVSASASGRSGSAPANWRANERMGVKRPTPCFGAKCISYCNNAQNIRGDLDRQEGGAHTVKNEGNIDFAFCPQFGGSASTAPPGTLDPGRSIEARDTIRAHRAALIRLLDSAARLLPGDGWITGQRVRFTVDQQDLSAAYRVTKESPATTRWWCTALSAYVLETAGDSAGARRAWHRVPSQMAPDVQSRWSAILRLFV